MTLDGNLLGVEDFHTAFKPLRQIITKRAVYGLLGIVRFPDFQNEMVLTVIIFFDRLSGSAEFDRGVFLEINRFIDDDYPSTNSIQR